MMTGDLPGEVLVRERERRARMEAAGQIIAGHQAELDAAAQRLLAWLEVERGDVTGRLATSTPAVFAAQQFLREINMAYPA
jgi:hypothetical protein